MFKTLLVKVCSTVKSVPIERQVRMAEPYEKIELKEINIDDEYNISSKYITFDEKGRPLLDNQTPEKATKKSRDESSNADYAEPYESSSRPDHTYVNVPQKASNGQRNESIKAAASTTEIKASLNNPHSEVYQHGKSEPTQSNSEDDK